MFAPRFREGQDSMLREHALVLPVTSRFNHLPLAASTQLLAFSGNAFFASKSEESAFCDFFWGLCPQPRCRAQEDAFQRGDIGLDERVIQGDAVGGALEGHATLEHVEGGVENGNRKEEDTACGRSELLMKSLLVVFERAGIRGLTA